MANYPTTTRPPLTDISQRKVALIAGFGLLFMAVLAPFAHFGVLETLVVPMDATATVMPATMVAWAAGWSMTISAGIALDPGWPVFGSIGAVASS